MMMRILRFLFLCLATSWFTAHAQDLKFQDSNLNAFLTKPSESETAWVTQDLHAILKTAGFPSDSIEINKEVPTGDQHFATVQCSPKTIRIHVRASEAEWSATAYKALRELGFLFPHANRQISPTLADARKHCGQKIVWDPRFPVRGFHLHTMHPNEWVNGLFLGKIETALPIIPWLKRNGQNLLQVQMINVNTSKFSNHLQTFLKTANEAKLLTALSVSFSLYQQKGMYLLPWWSAMTGWRDEAILRSRIAELQNTYPFQLMTFELGTTEFTAAPYKKTLKWIEIARQQLKTRNQMIFNKIHSSSGQQSEQYGNFNYLPQYSAADVGVLPHTVMAYSLSDEAAPVYGLKSFHDMKNYLAEQSSKRPTIYYPETSYYCSMDIDLPLFLTDYLTSRSEDMTLIEKYPVWGQVNFTTGQDMGYWLMDWTTALLADGDHKDDPYIGLKLLGEDIETWKKIIAFQTKHFKKNQLLQLMSFANLQDELNFFGDVAQYVHFRTLIRDYFHNPKSEGLALEIKKLEAALAEMPSTENIRSRELQILVDVTFLRIKHALLLRKSIADARTEDVEIPFPGIQRALASLPAAKSQIAQAKEARELALGMIGEYHTDFQDFKGTLVSECHDNPTSYVCGYGWTARTLYHWQREEEMVDNRIYNPFYRTYYKFFRHLF